MKPTDGEKPLRHEDYLAMAAENKRMRQLLAGARTRPSLRARFNRLSRLSKALLILATLEVMGGITVAAGGLRGGFWLIGTQQASAPTGTNIAGKDRVWVKSSNDHLYLTDVANVDHDLTAGGGSGTLATAYSTGATQTDSTVLLDATRLGVRVRDNGTPITGGLFGVQDSAGTTKYLDITNAATQRLTCGMADGASAVALIVDTTTAWSNATAKLASFQSGGSEKLVIGKNGFLYPGAGQASTAVNVPAWTTVLGGVGFQNGWTSWGAPYAAVAYYRDALGFVHLRGLAKGGTSVAFTFPAGYRPAATLGFSITANGNAAGFLSIAANGDVSPTGAGAGASFALDGIIFAAEQ